MALTRSAHRLKAAIKSAATAKVPALPLPGMNQGDTPVKLFVLRIKPKDKPLMLEVPAPH